MKTFKSFALLVLFSAFCTALYAQSAAVNKAQAMKIYDNLNKKDFDSFSTILADNAIDYAGPEPVNGKERITESLREFMTAFPDMTMQVEKIVAEGNTVMAYINVSGTFKNDFMGMKATGKSFNFKDVDIIEFDNAGRATAHWSVQDPMVMMSQISN